MLPKIEAALKGFDAVKESLSSVEDEKVRVKGRIEQMGRDLIAWNDDHNPARRDLYLDMDDESRNVVAWPDQHQRPLGRSPYATADAEALYRLKDSTYKRVAEIDAIL